MLRQTPPPESDASAQEASGERASRKSVTMSGAKVIAVISSARRLIGSGPGGRGTDSHFHIDETQRKEALRMHICLIQRPAIICTQRR